MTFEDRLRQLGFVNLEKRQFWGDLSKPCTYMEGIMKMDAGFSQGCMIGG